MKLENINGDFSKLNDKLHLTSKTNLFPCLNSTVIKPKLLNNDLADKIYELYKLDFDILGYDKDSWINY